MKRFKQIFNHQPPARLIALGFASTILLGTLLLLMPFSIRSGITVQPVDALFSATSAVCVTGLLTVDTADTFTPVGQVVMAVLIQIGGLGITSIGMGLALAAGRRISLRERTLIREAMNVSSLEGMVRLVRAIIKLTLAFELAGVIPIFAVFAQDYPPLKALGLSVFHSISSFNNAGIDILGGGRSLTPYRDNVLLNLSTCFLIISGGIGFLVMVDVVKCRFRFRKFTLHSKVVVTTTAFLLAAGTLLLKFTDPLSWLTAFFLSVSARTAGFATLDLGKLSNAGLFTILILMFIGASPGSTGGGIKISRIIIMCKTAKQDLMRVLHPHAVTTVRFEGKPLDDKTVFGVRTYMNLYLIIFVLSTMVVAINQFDLVTTFTAVASCLNNIGPGLELVGPMVSFADFSPLIKLVLSFDMLVGRLEIFPMLVLFAPSTWLRSKGHLDRRLRARNLF